MGFSLAEGGERPNLDQERFLGQKCIEARRRMIAGAGGSWGLKDQKMSPTFGFQKWSSNQRYRDLGTARYTGTSGGTYCQGSTHLTRWSRLCPHAGSSQRSGWFYEGARSRCTLECEPEPPEDGALLGSPAGLCSSGPNVNKQEVNTVQDRVPAWPEGWSPARRRS